MANTQTKSLFTADLVVPAIKASFLKLNPKELVRNPVMFVTATVAALMTVLLVIGQDSLSTGFKLQLAVWLWLTVLFGTFACFALIGGVMIDRRKRRRMGDRWTRLTLSVGKTAPWPAVGDMNTVRRLAAGVLLYAVLIALHPRLFGVSPLP